VLKQKYFKDLLQLSHCRRSPILKNYCSAWFHHKRIFKSFTELVELVYVIVIVRRLRTVVIGLRQNVT